ncbi:MAG: vitamin K epoxide reductase family protein [Fimbriimonadaceae bacterium]|nr:vitamin K epoxide reductase family protein [Fimbriimonadaceae bacterium]
MLAVWTNRVTTVLAWVGVFIAGTLTIAHFGHIVPPCSGNDHGCAIVQSSKQASFMGVPVALLGLFAYAVLAAMAAIRIKSPDQWKTLAMRGLVISGLGTGFSAYLTWIAFTELHAACQWCLSSLGVMTALFLSHGLLVQAGEPGEIKPRSEWTTFGVAGIVALGAIGGMVTQMKSMSAILASKIDVHGTTVEAILGRPEQIQGNADAKVTLVEFADYNCPACRQAAVTVTKLYTRYGGKLKWAYRHLPLPNLKGHETSMLAARIAEVAADQGKFWKYTEIVLDPANTEKVKSESGLMAIAQQAGVDMADLNKRLQDPADKLNDQVAEDMDIAMNKLKSNTTPTLLLIVEGRAPVAVGADQLESTLKGEPFASLLK